VQVYWLILLPPYLYQGAYGLWQAFTYCALGDEYVLLKRTDSYDYLIENPTFEVFSDFLISASAPSRFNLVFDLLSFLAAAYFNNWIMAAWFGVATPINYIFEGYFLLLPLADMPPFFSLAEATATSSNGNDLIN